MKKLPFLLALAADYSPINPFGKSRRQKPLSNPFADRDAIEKAQQKRARRAEKRASINP